MDVHRNAQLRSPVCAGRRTPRRLGLLGAIVGAAALVIGAPAPAAGQPTQHSAEHGQPDPYAGYRAQSGTHMRVASGDTVGQRVVRGSDVRIVTNRPDHKRVHEPAAHRAERQTRAHADATVRYDHKRHYHTRTDHRTYDSDHHQRYRIKPGSLYLRHRQHHPRYEHTPDHHRYHKLRTHRYHRSRSYLRGGITLDQRITPGSYHRLRLYKHHGLYLPHRDCGHYKHHRHHRPHIGSKLYLKKFHHRHHKFRSKLFHKRYDRFHHGHKKHGASFRLHLRFD